MQAFLSLFNGMSLKWKLGVSGATEPFGFLAVNQLSDIEALPALDFPIEEALGRDPLFLDKFNVRSDHVNV
jgi:hypothetical protein